MFSKYTNWVLIAQLAKKSVARAKFHNIFLSVAVMTYVLNKIPLPDCSTRSPKTLTQLSALSAMGKVVFRPRLS